LLLARARAHRLAGEDEAARARLEHALEVAEDAGHEVCAEVHTSLGVLHHGRRRLVEAQSAYERALALLGADAEPRARARLVANLAALDHDRRESEAARAGYERALALLEGAGDPRLSGITLTNLAVLEQEQGDLLAALNRYERARTLLERAGDARLLGITLGNIGALHHDRDDLEAARRTFEEAREALGPTGDRASMALTEARLAAVLADAGQVPEAQTRASSAMKAADAAGDALARASAELAMAFLEVARARDETNDARAAGARLARARRLAEAVRTPAEPGAPSPVELSDDVRGAMRRLERSLVRASEGLDAEPVHERDALVVSRDGAWFRPPGGAWQDLEVHRAQRAVLGALVDQHRLAPGLPLTVEALVRAGWPGERVQPQAAKNRLHVTLSKLRKRGLTGHLERDGTGYRLTPALRVGVGAPIDD
jgi:tetratricopeptide (TPR) repeat protein